MKAACAILTMFLASLSLTCKAKEQTELHIIPQPESVTLTSGTFKVIGAAINCDDRFDEKARLAIQEFANQLSLVSGKISSFAAPHGLASIVEKGEFKGIVFIKDNSMAEEEYSIDVTAKNTLIKANSMNGVLYAIQTIKQILPECIYGNQPSPAVDWKIPCVSIKDKPRFAYRGMHIDCARHFFSVEEVKKYLDVMAVYKLNRLHWHLSDDQGWRIEIKKYPELTLIGGYRKGTMIGHDFNSNDGKRYGGYYTQEQVKDIISYAANLGITIIPEIDLPGHMLGALSAYPQLGCSGGPYETWTKWGISPQVLCPGKEATFEFLEGVLGEIAELFPSEYIHIGGDECPKTEWEKCPDCQARIKELGIKATDEYSAEQLLQNYVTKRVQDYLATLGKKIIGWDEILEGELAPGATVMSWRGTKGGIKAAGLGYDVIMTPNSFLYLDYCQSADKDSEPLNIGGNLPVEKVYSYEPFDGIDEQSQKHILGVQANLWTEYIATNEHLEYMLLPRMLALSEIQWCQKDVKNYDRFTKSVVDHEFKVLDTMGYTYAKILVGIPGNEIIK